MTALPTETVPAIPVANLLRIAFYAGDLLEELDDCKAAREEGRTFEDVLQAMLVRAASRIRLRGFDRGYRIERESTSRPRGRILVAPSIAAGRLALRRLECEVDDFGTDTPHNRVLKASAAILARCDTSSEHQDSLRTLIREMRDISDVPLDRRLLRSLPRTPSAHRYRVVRFIARLLLDAGQPDAALGDEWARRLLRDEVRMRRVFEAFVRRFARMHAPPGVRVGRPRLVWSDRPHPLVGVLETDVTLRGQDWTRIIECKYTAAATTRGLHGREIYRPEHLRQLYAYLARTRDLVRSPRTIEGVLLYPALAEGMRNRIDLGGFPVEVVRLALDCPWNEINRQLERLLASP
jgi:5-methylcytosine-specific restriction enzyme subunit McrC